MFTGIIETTGTVFSIENEGSNIHFWISSPISSECKVDQSVSHNGVCLTITLLKEGIHRVTAIKETLDKSNLSELKIGDIINLERCLKIGDRLDGHMVQGHVDGVGLCKSIKEEDGSWVYEFGIQAKWARLIVNKGSVCINGVSLTVNEPAKDSFKVAIIPYTYEHTNFRYINSGDSVNLEFDIIGKYLERYMELVKTVNSE